MTTTKPIPLAALLLFTVGAGCTADEPVALRVGVTVGTAPAEAFVAVVGLGDRPVRRLECPGDDTAGPARCQGSAVLVTNAPSRVSLTIKKRGFAFVQQTLTVGELAVSGGHRSATVDLTALAPFDDNADYATGFEETGGLERFLQLAHAMSTELGPSHAVKFYIADLDGAPRVYFQNTRTHPLHYTFARNVLGATATLSEYEAATYHGPDRSAMAGTLVYYAKLRTSSATLGTAVEDPLTVNFFPSDDLSPAQAARAHRLLEERLGFAPLSGSRSRVVYLPAGASQQEDLALAAERLAEQDVPWLSREELYGNVRFQLLNPGLAYGTLKRVTPEQLETEVVSFTDILVLAKLPNSLPIVGGTIAEERQTPLAHVNVAARSRGTPNISLLDASTDPRVADLLGELVRFEVKDGGFTLDKTTLAEAEAFWASRSKEPLLPELDLTRHGLPGLEALGFADAISVGAKAANAAELHRLLGKKGPRGFAVPFYYYDRFINTAEVTTALCDAARVDCEQEQRAAAICLRAHRLCAATSKPERIADYISRLLADAELKLDAPLREAALDGLRYHLRHIPVDAAFAAELDDRVAKVFGDQKARLRSSTNAEDLATFSGAGLYSSVSAYGRGTSKLASSQIRKVWASVWNWRAFEERSFWNIDHHAVRMGVLVNQAISDEVANGVLITQNIVDPFTAGMYVNVQKGEVSVTNPADGALPEIFSIIPHPDQGVQVARVRFSSLSPEAPLLTEAQIAALYGAAAKVQRHFAPLYGVDPFALALDLEFKFYGPDEALMIKQARPYLQQQ